MTCRNVVSLRKSRLAAIVFDGAPSQNRFMRALASLLALAGIAGAIYFYSLKKLPVSDLGTTPTQTISLTGVRMDLMQIAEAERSFIAQNGHCASMDELISSQSLAMKRPERDGYLYTADCAAADFTVTARHEPAPAGSSIRYPVLAIDSLMEVREVN